MSETKDLAYYQNNPHELGNLSDAELDALAQGDTGSQPESGEPPEAAVTDPVEVKEPAPATVEPESAEPQGVATKDGKHIIPFEVLDRERKRVAELERIAREQAEQIETLAASATGKEPEKTGDDATVLSEAELAELEVDYPAFGKLLRAQQAQIKALGETVQNLNAEREQREEQGQRTVQQTIQEAIDDNPKLAYLQVQSPETWERAVRFDSTLRADPEWAEKSFADRFAKVVELYEATYGQIALATAKEPEPTKTPEELAKEAEAKLKAKAAPVPASLSAIPGGSTPAADDVTAQLATKSGPELTADFMRMSPQQIEAMLARL